MKNFMILTALVVFPLSVLFAHPASEINADYKTGSKTLTVDVKHMVSASKNTDLKKHYIKEISVTLNGAKVKTQSFTSQTGDSINATFKFDAKAGDKIGISTVCSIAGTKTSEIIVK